VALVVLCTIAIVSAAGLYGQSVHDIYGYKTDMSIFTGNVSLVVNVASE